MSRRPRPCPSHLGPPPCRPRPPSASGRLPPTSTSPGRSGATSARRSWSAATAGRGPSSRRSAGTSTATPVLSTRGADPSLQARLVFAHPEPSADLTAPGPRVGRPRVPGVGSRAPRLATFLGNTTTGPVWRAREEVEGLGTAARGDETSSRRLHWKRKLTHQSYIFREVPIACPDN